jgi:putative ABC transport system permease protein
MFLNYLKVFLRLFARNRLFTLINLLGLTAGIACFILIRLYVLNETVYDKHIPDAEYTYRLGLKGDMSGFSFETATMGGPFGRVIRDEIPGVYQSTTFYKLPRPGLLSRLQNRFYEESIIYADSVFIEFFGYRALLGDPELMLKDPYSMVLSASGARKYFGDENPLGKVIRWNNRRDYTVTGVIEDSDKNSHLHFDVLASYGSLLEQANYNQLLTTFYAFVTYNYIKTDPSLSPDSLEAKIAGIVAPVRTTNGACLTPRSRRPSRALRRP